MRFELTEEQRNLQQELRLFLDDCITPELLEEQREKPDGGPLWERYIQQLGEAGWLGVGWPKEYGGGGKTPLEQYIFLEEIDRSGVNIPYVTLETVGPALMEIGTEEQKNYFLPKILKGELEISIGYTEPEAGSDLASIKTTAIKDGDSYIINGQKVFTTNAHIADYIWLAARTDLDAPKHKGISIFLIPTNVAGFSTTPLYLMGERTNATYYENMRVPADTLVGKENKGWHYITTQLSLERLMLSTYSLMERTVHDTICWANDTVVDGEKVINHNSVQEHLAELTVDIDILRLLNYRAAWSHLDDKKPFRPSMNKVYAADLHQKVYDTCMQVLGMFGPLEPNSKLAVADGRIAELAKRRIVYLFGGGSNDPMRDLVARFGLGLPRK